ncbi:secreted protein [Candidatus Magnetomorum sp. HK-1]|nr:secreted protein [Candidatus Magnetomorum sp. HK-1]
MIYQKLRIATKKNIILLLLSFKLFITLLLPPLTLADEIHVKLVIPGCS